MSTETLESRVKALEAKIAELEKRLPAAEEEHRKHIYMLRALGLKIKTGFEHEATALIAAYGVDAVKAVLAEARNGGSQGLWPSKVGEILAARNAPVQGIKAALEANKIDDAWEAQVYRNCKLVLDEIDKRPELFAGNDTSARAIKELRSATKNGKGSETWLRQLTNIYPSLKAVL